MHPAMRRAAAATLTVSALLALGACRSSSPADASATGSAVAAPPSPTASPRGSATPSAASSATSSATGSTTGSTTVPPSSTDAGCRNLVATTAVKAEVTQAYQAAAHLYHIQPRAGGFLYGSCGNVTYAETRFTATAQATTDEEVALQDEGSSRKYFSLGSTGTWTYLGTGGFPDTGGCLGQIPHPLAVIWGDCSTR